MKLTPEQIFALAVLVLIVLMVVDGWWRRRVQPWAERRRARLRGLAAGSVLRDRPRPYDWSSEEIKGEPCS